MIDGRDEMSEAEALDDSGFQTMIEGEVLEFEPIPLSQHFKMKELYENAEKASVGSMIRCAGCGKKIKKKSYQSKYCSNKGRGNCKDYYHNATNIDRFNRMNSYRSGELEE